MDIAEKLAQLRMSFRSKAELELKQLSDVAARVTGGTQTQSRLGEDILSAYQLLHRLAGSAGTFGYTALGAEARKLEQRLKPVMERRAFNTDKQWVDPEADIQQVLDTLALAAGLRPLLDKAEEP